MAFKPFTSGHLLAAADVNDLVGVNARITTPVDIVSSAAETNLVSSVVAANAMSTDRAVRCTIVGDYLNNSGGTATLTLRVKLGATTMWGDLTGSAIAASAVRREFRLVLEIANRGATNSQKLSGFWALSAAVAGSVAGIGDIDGGGNLVNFGGTAAIDTTAAATIAVSAQHGASNANLSIRMQYAVLELL